MHYIDQVAKAITAEVAALIILIFVFALGIVVGRFGGYKAGLKRGLDESFSKSARIKMP